jgi:hypothetical protein
VAEIVDENKSSAAQTMAIASMARTPTKSSVVGLFNPVEGPRRLFESESNQPVLSSEKTCKVWTTGGVISNLNTRSIQMAKKGSKLICLIKWSIQSSLSLDDEKTG